MKGRRKKQAAAVVGPVDERAKPEARVVEIGLIDESPTNPRKHYDEQKLAELGESILRHGVLEPILLRLKKDGRYEIVAGHRRYRAARLVALPIIPTIIHELTDKEVLEIQIVENLQREGLTALEEADGYAQLIRQHGYDADSLALKIGKSRSYVYGRMKLADCCALAKDALREGRISHSVALLLARIPDEKVQRAATKELLRNVDDDGISFREAANIIDREFLLRLGDACWDLADAELLPQAGPCTTCPFRSGNQADLVETRSADVCTNPKCYREKQDALWSRRQQEAKSRGDRVLPRAEVPKVFETGQWSRGAVLHNAPYVDLDASASAIGHYGKTYRQVLGKKFAPPITVARSPKTGRVHELVTRKDLNASVKAAGAEHADVHRGRDPYRDQQRAETAKRKLERAIEQAIIAAATGKLEELPLNEETLRIFTTAIAVERYYKIESWLKRRGHVDVTWEKREKLITKLVAELSVGQMLGLIAESLMSFNPTELRRDTDSVTQRKLCELAGVDWRAIEKELRDAAASKKKAADARVKKKAAKAKAPRASKAATPAAKKRKAVERSRKMSAKVKAEEASRATVPTEHRIDFRDGETAPYVVQGRVTDSDEWKDVGRRFGSQEAALELFPEAWCPSEQEGDGELQILHQRIGELAAEVQP